MARILRNLINGVLLVALFGLLQTGSAAAEEDDILQWSGSWPYGPSEAVAVDEARSLAFVDSGGAVLLLDVSNPNAPTLVSDQVISHGDVLDLAYDESRQLLFLAAGESGFEVWDAADPAQPALLSRMEILYFGVEVPVEGVVLLGNFAYVATNFGYLHWIDVSDPENPVDAGFNGIGGNPTIGISTDGTYLYTCGATFTQWTIQGNGTPSAGNYHDFTFCSLPYGYGNYGYTASGSSLYIMDGTAPYFPIVGTYQAPGSVLDIRITGSTGYLLYFGSSQSGLQILDMSNPPNPVLLGTLDLPASGGMTALSADRAYIANSKYGLQIADVKDPSAPELLGGYATQGTTYDTRLVGNTAYIAGTDRLEILDVSDPADPILLGQVLSGSLMHDVAVQDGIAYTADWTGGFRIFDVSDPANPQEIGGDNSYAAWLVDVQGGYAYVVEALPNQDAPLHVYDISDPGSPVETGTLMLPDFINEIEVRGSYLYIADYDNGLRIVDVSDPYNPHTQTLYPLPDVSDFALQGSLAYIASTDWDGGLVILDISNPAAPDLVSIYNPNGWYHPNRAEVSGTYLYMSDVYSEIQIFDVSDPENPVELGTYQTAGGLYKMTAAGSMVYVSDGTAGMIALHNVLASPFAAAFNSDSDLQGLPGETVIHTFILTNLGLDDTYDLSVSGAAWPTSLVTATPVSLAAGESVSVTVSVDIPVSLTGMATDDLFTLTAQSQADANVSATAAGTTQAIAPPPAFSVFLPIVVR